MIRKTGTSSGRVFLNESPSEKEGKSLPENSPQPCGRNGCFARTSRRLHAKLYTPTTSTPA